MHPYFASQDTLASRARLNSFVQPLGQARSRAKVSCIKFKTRHVPVCAQGSSVNYNIIILCLYIFIECIFEYKIPYRRALSRVRRASKGIVHTKCI